MADTKISRPSFRRVNGDTVLIVAILAFLLATFVLVIQAYKRIEGLNRSLTLLEGPWLNTKSFSLNMGGFSPENLSPIKAEFLQGIDNPEFSNLERYSPGLTDHVERCRMLYRSFEAGLKTPSSSGHLWETAALLDRALFQLKTRVNRLTEKAFGSFRSLLFTLFVFSFFILFIFFHRSFQLSRIRLKEDSRRKLTRLSVQMHEEERKKLARELHDGLAQNVALTRTKINYLAEKLEMLKTHPEYKKEYKTIEELLSSSLSEIRSLATALRPPDFVHGGLAASVENLCAAFQSRYGLNIYRRFQVDHISIGSKEKAVQFLRILQEGFVNIVKHSGGKTVYITLKVDGKTLLADLGDDGVGLGNYTEGLGMQGARERVRMLGGSVSWVSGGGAAGSGTVMKITIPLEGLSAAGGLY
jgi:signal transduction histidine kinase